MTEEYHLNIQRKQQDHATIQDLLSACKNALATLAILTMSRLDATVADNATLLRVLSESLQAAISKAECRGARV